MTRNLFDTFVVRNDPNAEFDHWQGGEPFHDGAVCPQCSRSLQLIWNINAADPRFRTLLGRRLLPNLNRVPLYYCFPCFSYLDYIVSPSGSFELLCFDGIPLSEFVPKRPEIDFPYPNFPLQFEKHKIGLFLARQFPKSLLKFIRADPPLPLTDSRQLEIEKHFGVHVSKNLYDALGLTFTKYQQFGGSEFMPQGDEHIVCRNTLCPRHGAQMSFLAAISNNPLKGLPLVQTLEEVRKNDGNFNDLVRFYFHICRKCDSIHAESQGS